MFSHFRLTQDIFLLLSYRRFPNVPYANLGPVRSVCIFYTLIPVLSEINEIISCAVIPHVPGTERFPGGLYKISFATPKAE